MKIVKGILIALGVFFAFLICITVYLSHSSSKFMDENKEFINQFSYDLSRNWSASDVHSRLSNSFLQSLETPVGQFSFNQLKALGNLEKATSFELTNFKSGTEGTIAVVTFKAIFENAKGLVTITVIEQEEKVLVQGFHFHTSDGVNPISSKHEA